MSVSSLLLFINFLLEIRIIYEIWLNQNPSLRSNFRLLRKKLFMFYIIYHTLLFALVLNVTNIFKNEYIIILLSITIWIPDIIRNVFKVKIKSIPLFILIIMSFNRIYQFIYYKLTDKSYNVLHIHKNINVVIIVVLLVVIQITIIYLQVVYDGNFFISEKFKIKIKSSKQKNIEYISYSKVIKLCKDNEDCLICMNKIIDKDFKKETILQTNKVNNQILNTTDYTDNNINSINADLNSINNNVEEVHEHELNSNENDENNKFFKNKKYNNTITSLKSNYDNMSIDGIYNKSTGISTRRNYLNKVIVKIKSVFINKASKINKLLNNIIKKYINISKLYNIISSFLSFIYKVFFTFHNFKQINQSNYILTECNHIFHSNCINNWLKIKQQCPIDRKILIPEE